MLKLTVENSQRGDEPHYRNRYTVVRNYCHLVHGSGPVRERHVLLVDQAFDVSG
jgi:hypothetical protein